jgi:hypothetical protein
MKRTITIPKLLAATAASAALLVAPGLAAGDSGTPGPDASAAAKAKAYGVHCQGESKKHVAGQKGTPFSQCVTAMAKLATGTTTSPKLACKSLSHKRVAGQKGTPYSQCIKAAAKLKAKKPKT